MKLANTVILSSVRTNQTVTNPPHVLVIAGVLLFSVTIVMGCSADSKIPAYANVSATETTIQEKQASKGTETENVQKSSQAKSTENKSNAVEGKNNKIENEKKMSKTQTATFGNGCYWCTEAVFQRLKGVKSVTSGFSGGHVDNPSYQAVCQETTGHAEVLQIEFDPEAVSFEKLLEVFWSTHDPTTLNRQGNDRGTQYRSAVFYHSDQQKQLAQKYKTQLDKAGAFSNPIVTEITRFEKFFKAPEYHQDYYNQNKSKNPYCSLIKYKLEKFREAFKDVIDDKKDAVK